MSIIHFSETESRILGLKLGRADAQVWQWKELKNELEAEHYDVCVWKTNCRNPELFVKLREMDVPYSMAGAVVKYRIFYGQFEPRIYEHSGFDYRIVDSASEHLVSLIKKTFHKEPVSYYQIPLYNEKVSRELELECLVEYLSSFCTPEKKLVEIYIEGELAGLIAFRLEGKVHECVLTGLLPKFQSQGYYQDLVSACLNASFELNPAMKWSYCGARIHNVPSHRAFVKAGLEYFESVYNIYLTPFLNGKA